RDALRSPVVKRRATVPARPARADKTNAEPEVLVRFRPGTTLDAIKSLAFGNHDRVVDEIESVNGLVAIDDLDNADAQSVADQYSRMDGVAYAEVNDIIKLDNPTTGE